MSPAPNTNVVHESEAQRQYPRVRLPGVLQTELRGAIHEFKLVDVSAGGICFESAGQVFTPGDTIRGTLVFTVNAIGFTIPVTMQVKSANREAGRVGCQFQDLGARETGALRHMITSFMSGEVVSAGEMLHTLGRDNFAKPRPDRDAGSLTGRARARALLLSGIALAAGVLAFCYVLFQIYSIYFVTRAKSAKVFVPMLVVTMPRDGVFSSLVPPEGGAVQKGAQLGSIQSAMVDIIKPPTDWSTLTPAVLSSLVGTTVQGTVTSPCDCRVMRTLVAQSQPVNRGQPLFELLPSDAKPVIQASFLSREVGHLGIGRSVSFRLGGETFDRRGSITQLRVPETQGGAIPDQILATIEPNYPLALDSVNQPADVVVSPLSSLGKGGGQDPNAP